MNIVSIDCDLRRLYAIHVDSRAPFVLCNKCTRPDALEVIASCVDDHRPTVLMEIAGTPYARVDSRAAARQTARWSVFNAGVAGELNGLCEDVDVPFLVATSTVWTRNIPVKERHAAARATLRNKDLRECEAMIWSYRNMNSLWIPYAQYLDEKL